MVRLRDNETLEEAELLARSLRHDRDAFGLLVTRHAASIFNAVTRIVGEGADAQDLAQETFIAAFKALPTFRNEAKFSTWLYRIAVNKCRDWLRTHRRFIEVPEQDDDVEAREVGVEHRTPEHALSQKELAGQLHQAMQALPILYREAFVLKHVEGLSYDEMSSILAVHPDTLKMRVYKARIKLCENLSKVHAELT